MAGQQEIDIVVIVFGTMGMLILALALVAFVILYQKKRVSMEIEQVQRENEYQKELLNAIIEVREKEQKRISLDLHDNIGSSLNNIKMTLSKSNISDEDIVAVRFRIKNLVSQIRQISYDLLPPVLNEYGLNGAIKNLCRRISEQTGTDIKCHIEDEQIGLFKPEIELAFYRITQELLNNILKHAQATSIKIYAGTKDDYYHIVIEDDGNGFIPPKKLDFQSSSLGLKNIASRIQQLNASIKFELLQPKGTRVELKRNLNG
jgi:signal transduction histidine kinase